MFIFSKRIGLKIPKHIEVFYNQKKNLLLLVGPLGSKTVVLNFKLFLASAICYIFVVVSSGKVKKKQVKCYCGTLLAKLKQIILELSVKYHLALRLFGVGFKAYVLNIGVSSALQFKLGFSHFIFYKIPTDICVIPLKNIKLFVTNSCLKAVTQTSAFIRSFKVPDIYKGKGILYNKEIIVLKKGKRVS